MINETEVANTRDGVGEIRPEWIAVDWGSTRLRAWAMSQGNDIIGERASGDGSGGLTSEEFEERLIETVGDWLSPERVTPVIACGMVGSRQGWMEAPYAQLPAAPSATGAVQPQTRDARISVHILGGACQSQPADVMRGEETQIAGLLAEHGMVSGMVCLPGTHTKWVAMQNGVMARMATAMTGEMFALLSGSSVLRHGVQTAGWDEDGFGGGVEAALAAPLQLSEMLFSIRAEGLLHGLPPEMARARLSGLLIGSEIAAHRAGLDDGPVHLVGAPDLTALYRRALTLAGISTVEHDGARMTLAGLIHARNLMKEEA